MRQPGYYKPISFLADMTYPEPPYPVEVLEVTERASSNFTFEGLYRFEEPKELTGMDAINKAWEMSQWLPRKKKKAFRRYLQNLLIRVAHV